MESGVAEVAGVVEVHDGDNFLPGETPIPGHASPQYEFWGVWGC
jgi:hypothetical protein